MREVSGNTKVDREAALETWTSSCLEEYCSLAVAAKDKATSGGATPITMASQKGHLKVVQFLLKAKADKDKAATSQ